MAIAREEVFGPVLSVLTFRTLDSAGLGEHASTVFLPGYGARTSTPALSSRGAGGGTVWTNTWMDGFPEVTFGGMKQSGGPRDGRYGMEEFLEVKSLVMRIGRTRAPWVKET